MRVPANLDSVRRERVVAVDWHDCAWSPPITVQPRTPVLDGLTKRLPALPSILHTMRCHPAYLKTMKTILPSTRRQRAGFTLIELLVVIAIIGILASLLLPVIATVTKHAKMAKAKTEAQGIAQAIQSYDSQYGRLPVSTATQTAAGAGDYTYGGSLLSANPTDNSEVIAILMDITDPAKSLVNTNHVKNPKQTVFLNAKMSGDTSSSGVGTDLIYRDPWGHPYIISMDLNYDGITEDAFYGLPAVSSGVGGLAVQPDGNYGYNGKVMVWSAGPDGQINPNPNPNPPPVGSANLGVNKDNVTSW